ncbi:hypothetical protein KEM56_003869 [Ascosphaera pollenicola]|nr:hypothetical protein KEM56_003869 [Ascosphaera pollenicola]
MAVVIDENGNMTTTFIKRYVDLSEGNDTATRSIRGRKTPSSSFVKETPRKGKARPTTLKEASDRDRMMFAMRDQDKPWSYIQEKWEVMTGEAVSSGQLRARYSDLKTAFRTFSENNVRTAPSMKVLSAILSANLDAQDNPLLQAKAEIESKLEIDK